MAIVAVAVVGPGGVVLNTVAHDGTPFSAGELPPGWTPGVFPEGCTFLPIEDTPQTDPIEPGVVYDEQTETFARVD